MVTLCSDNGTQFTSDEFQSFLKQNSIKHITSPTYHAPSNGAAENSVKTVKNFLIKELNMHNNIIDFNRSVDRFLMTYRITEHCSTGDTPSRLFLGRQIRSRFDLLNPCNINDIPPKSTSEICNNLLKAQNKNKKYFKGERDEKFSVGQCVYAKDYRNIRKPTWTVAHVNKILGKNVYLVTVYKSDNLVWKRHLNQLRKCEILNSSESDLEIVNDDENILVTSDTPIIISDSPVNVENPFSLLRDNEPRTSSSRTSFLIENRPKRTRKSPDRLKY